MVAIPLVKLFSLTVKTLAKPMAKRIKSEAQKRPSVRGVLNAMGQTVNSISLRVSIRMAGHTTTNIKPLDEVKAVAAGGELLAESFVYCVAGGLVVWEYMSSSKEKEEKDEKAKATKANEQRKLAEALEGINQRLANLEMENLDRRYPHEQQLQRQKSATKRSVDSDAQGASPPSRWSLPRILGGGGGGVGAGNSVQGSKSVSSQDSGNGASTSVSGGAGSTDNGNVRNERELEDRGSAINSSKGRTEVGLGVYKGR